MHIVGRKRNAVKRRDHPIPQNNRAVVSSRFGERYTEISDLLRYDGIASKLQDKNADNYNNIRKKEPQRPSDDISVH